MNGCANRLEQYALRSSIEVPQGVGDAADGGQNIVNSVVEMAHKGVVGAVDAIGEHDVFVPVLPPLGGIFHINSGGCSGQCA